LSDEGRVAVVYRQAPRSDAMIEVVERVPGVRVIESFVRTRETGRASVAVRPGHG
jgi:hypothetical protein